jgi:GTP-binding protein
MSAYPQARFLQSVNQLQQLPAEDGAEVAFAGRSNAGKSSAINAIVERHSLARKGKTPGQTRLINFFHLSESRRLVDLPGYGFAKVGAEMQAHWQELVGGYLQTRSSLVGLFLIVDSRRGLSDADHSLLQWAQGRLLPVRVLLSKCDKLTRNEAREIAGRTQKQLPELARAQQFSALKKQGVDEARTALNEMLS